MKYLELAKLIEALESTTKRLEMTSMLTEFLKNTKADELKEVILLLQGRAFPEYSEEVIGVASKLMVKAISKASGIKEEEIIRLWKETGDLGITAENVLKKKKQMTLRSEVLTTSKVLSNLQALSKLTGKGTVSKKLGLISELLMQASPKEAKYIVRTILGILRVGVGGGIIRDALAEAFNCDKELIERAYNLLADYSEVAVICATKGDSGLKKVSLSYGSPVKVMLYQKEEDIKEGFKRVGKPCSIQYKYDGLRLQVHKKGDEVILFTRRLDNVTKMFPEVVEAVKKSISVDCIIEGEGVGYHPKLKSYKPFQEISKRIKRKYKIHELMSETPVVLYVFDILKYKEESCLEKPYKERLALLKKVVKEIHWRIELVKQIITSDEAEALKFYKEALSKDQEGVMMKNLNAPYQPGSRVGYGVKIKPIMEPLDLVITGAEWGQGRRAHWLSSFVLACKSNGKLLEIGKMGTGLSDEQFSEITKKLKPLIISEEGKQVKVKPVIIVEVGYEEIQKSPTYSSGYALRFPRLMRFRPDKEEPDSIERIIEIYKSQGKSK